MVLAFNGTAALDKGLLSTELRQCHKPGSTAAPPETEPGFTNRRPVVDVFCRVSQMYSLRLAVNPLRVAFSNAIKLGWLDLLNGFWLVNVPLSTDANLHCSLFNLRSHGINRLCQQGKCINQGKTTTKDKDV